MAATPGPATVPTKRVDDLKLWAEIVEKVSAAQIFSDSKHFVDCPTTRAWEDVAQEWRDLKAIGITVEGLCAFLAANFGAPDRDIKPVLPLGWTDKPPSWTVDVADPELRALTGAVHELWKTLCRQVSPSVLAQPDRHTLLPLPYPFIIPGDRFRECYNWDSYWIIRGLIASELLPAAEQLLRNLLSLVDVWGMVPNGARTYYTNRSQPPLLSAMVLAVWDAGGDEALLAEALPRLVTQHGYWTRDNKAVALTGRGCRGVHSGSSGLEAAADTGDEGEVFVLSRYHAELYEPRPESFREDVHLAAKAGLQGADAAELYCQIASAAESGWDFSSRWFVGGEALEHTRTTQIVPADLNAWLYRTERDIAAIASHLGDVPLRDRFTELAAQRLRALSSLMWSAQDGCWHDLLLRNPKLATVPSVAAKSPAPSNDGDGGDGLTGSVGDGGCAAAGSRVELVYEAEQRPGVYASNWVPLWCGCAESGSAQAAAAVTGLLASGLVQEGGVLTSLYPSGQQWDAPNAWPPLVHMAIEGMAESGSPAGASAAAALAQRWVRANLAAWQATGHMHEKYDAYVPGGVGGGGEYAPQVGFGWSNGVLLSLLHRYCRGGA